MLSAAITRYSRLPTAAKLLLILTALLLPIGIALTFLGEFGIRQANSALLGRSQDQARSASQAIESLVARNVLALRIAANGAIATGGAAPCEVARRSLAIAPAVAQRFELESGTGRPICSVGDMGDTGSLPGVAPGDIRLQVSPDSQAIVMRTGVIGGMATAEITSSELRAAVTDAGVSVSSLNLHDSNRTLAIFDPPQTTDESIAYTQTPIGGGDVVVRVGMKVDRITTLDRLVLLLPVLMWVLAAVVTWLLVSRLLIRPLKRLERAVTSYQPGDTLDLPRRLGPSREIQEMRDAFARATTRVDDSEREMATALEGQRRLVREVHHRVKNNLQVVASLLNIHGRTAGTPDARAAYAGIGRRVGALSMVQRYHFAEMEENRGISIRPLLTELAAELRAGAPEAARRLMIDLEIETAYTTQDVAVAVAFLVTEIVEYAMLHRPSDPVEVSLRRTSELTACLTLSSPVLNPDEDGTPEKAQFERIIAGLARQLRSSLERKLGRYSVDLPVFPKSGLH